MIISIINHKGGTGKTTSAVNISACLADLGYKVLLVDLDSQANSSQALISDKDYTILNAIKDKKIDTNQLFHYNDKLSLLSASLDLHILEKELSDIVIAREKIFLNLFKPIQDSFDFIILDNPPSLSYIALYSIVCSEKVLIPLEAEFFSQTRLDNLILFFDEAKKGYDLNSEILGIFFTKYSDNTRLSEHFSTMINDDYKYLLLSSKIRKNVKLGEAHLNGQTILDYSNTSSGAVDYKQLTNEILGILN